jgi:hypothetical protein
MKKIALFLIAIIALVACDGNTPTGTKIESLTLTPNQLELKVGAEKRIRTSVKPATDEIYTVVWKSSNDAVATVDNKGNVVAVAAGSGTITATIEGTEISATASVNVVSPFDVLKFYTLALMGMDENFYQIDGVDSNQDGKNDTIYAVTLYALPESMYIQEGSLVGDDDYMMILNTAFSVCYDAELGGNVAYSLGGYGFSDVEEEYCAEINGQKRLLPHAASYTHFDEEKYLTVYGMLMEGKQDEANAYVEETGYWMGNLDSYIAYVNFESQQVRDAGYIVSGAGLETSSKSYDLEYYELGLKLFARPDAYGFATEMVEDPETGEMVETFVWPLEMGEMVEKTYTFGEPRTEEPAEIQARVSEQTVPFKAIQKQLSVNRALFSSLKVAFQK